MSFVQFETINYEWYEIKKICKNNYYKKFITPYTAIIDLHKWRRNLSFNETKREDIILK